MKKGILLSFPITKSRFFFGTIFKMSTTPAPTTNKTQILVQIFIPNGRYNFSVGEYGRPDRNTKINRKYKFRMSTALPGGMAKRSDGYKYALENEKSFDRPAFATNAPIEKFALLSETLRLKTFFFYNFI